MQEPPTGRGLIVVVWFVWTKQQLDSSNDDDDDGFVLIHASRHTWVHKVASTNRSRANIEKMN